jgi:hypothetical protein
MVIEDQRFIVRRASLPNFSAAWTIPNAECWSSAFGGLDEMLQPLSLGKHTNGSGTSHALSAGKNEVREYGGEVVRARRVMLVVKNSNLAKFLNVGDQEGS